MYEYEFIVASHVPRYPFGKLTTGVCTYYSPDLHTINIHFNIHTLTYDELHTMVRIIIPVLSP